jgi:hypothetical protein
MAQQHVNVHRREFRQHKASPQIDMQETFEVEADDPFPYLEQISVVAKRHPYAMLAGIITAVGSVLVAIGTGVAVVVSSMFTMYGTMTAMQADQKAFIENQAVIVNELKVMRTYNASVLSRQNFIAGLMSPDDQKRLMEFDRANPLYQPPPAPRHSTVPDN